MTDDDFDRMCPIHGWNCSMAPRRCSTASSARDRTMARRVGTRSGMPRHGTELWPGGLERADVRAVEFLLYDKRRVRYEVRGLPGRTGACCRRRRLASRTGAGYV